MNDAELVRLAERAGATLFLAVPMYREALSRFADEVVQSEGEQWRKVIAQRDRELRRDEAQVIAAFKDRTLKDLELALREAK